MMRNTRHLHIDAVMAAAQWNTLCTSKLFDQLFLAVGYAHADAGSTT